MHKGKESRSTSAPIYEPKMTYTDNNCNSLLSGDLSVIGFIKVQHPPYYRNVMLCVILVVQFVIQKHCKNVNTGNSSALKFTTGTLSSLLRIKGDVWDSLE